MINKYKYKNSNKYYIIYYQIMQPNYSLILQFSYILNFYKLKIKGKDIYIMGSIIELNSFF